MCMCNQRTMNSESPSTTVDQNLIQRTVQQHALNFVQILPKHIAEWRTALQESSGPVQALLNKSEQLRHVEK